MVRDRGIERKRDRETEIERQRGREKEIEIERNREREIEIERHRDSKKQREAYLLGVTNLKQAEKGTMERRHENREKKG